MIRVQPTIDRVNEIRRDLGLDPVPDLCVGDPSTAASCPISNTVNLGLTLEPGHEIATMGRAVQLRFWTADRDKYPDVGYRIVKQWDLPDANEYHEKFPTVFDQGYSETQRYRRPSGFPYWVDPLDRTTF